MATTNEETSEKATVNAWSLKSSPDGPWRYTIGKNTMVVGGGGGSEYFWGGNYGVGVLLGRLKNKTNNS